MQFDNFSFSCCASFDGLFDCWRLIMQVSQLWLIIIPACQFGIDVSAVPTNGIEFVMNRLCVFQYGY